MTRAEKPDTECGVGSFVLASFFLDARRGLALDHASSSLDTVDAQPTFNPG
jgi:hypothetical protein